MQSKVWRDAKNHFWWRFLASLLKRCELLLGLQHPGIFQPVFGELLQKALARLLCTQRRKTMLCKAGLWWDDQKFLLEVAEGWGIGWFCYQTRLCLCLLAHDIRDCVLCQAAQETCVVTRWKKN